MGAEYQCLQLAVAKGNDVVTDEWGGRYNIIFGVTVFYSVNMKRKNAPFAGSP